MFRGGQGRGQRLGGGAVLDAEPDPLADLQPERTDGGALPDLTGSWTY